MEIKGKKVLVIGLAVSGIPVVKVLSKLGAKVMVNDKKRAEELKESLVQLEDISAEYVLGDHPVRLADWPDFAVISPGVPMDIPLVQHILNSGKEVISEIELAYRLTRTPIIAITGTNGKTTTTALTGEIFKRWNKNTYVVGNIGTPIISVVLEAKPSDIMVAEISSFQLEGIRHFRPRAAAILNITPDHLNRHKTFENYVKAKARIFENQTDEDYMVLNGDDENTLKLARECRSRVVLFSRKDEPDIGTFIKDGYITIKNGSREEKVCPASSLKIPGEHNLENALAATALAWSIGVPTHIIREGLMSFEGVEHRLEYVASINGVRYINDSKGTNPDASIKAIRAIESPIILIAGGIDKGSSFDEFVDNFKGKVKGVVLLGETAEKIRQTCQKKGFKNIYIVGDMKEAVKVAAGIAVEGDCVLLSPACASWDMFKNFEERGRVFKEAVFSLGRH